MEGEPGPGVGEHSTSWMSHVVRTSTALVAVASAVLYLVGRLYLDSYYGRLGLLSSQIHADVADVMLASFLPLLAPIILLAGLAMIGSMVRAENEKGFAPFGPVPVVEALLIVFWTWAAKLFADMQYPAAPVDWLLWSRRDVLFFFFGLFLFGLRHWLHLRRRAGRTAGPFRSWTVTYAAVIGLPLIATGALSVARHEWILSPWRTVAAVLGVLLVLVYAAKDLRNPPPREIPKPPTRPNFGYLAFLYVVAAMGLLLAAGFHGSLDAKESGEGCSAIKTVSFAPAVNGDGNATYWLVHHAGGIFYVRDLLAMDGPTLAVSEDPSRVASLANAHAPRSC